MVRDLEKTKKSVGGTGKLSRDGAVSEKVKSVSSGGSSRSSGLAQSMLEPLLHGVGQFIAESLLSASGLTRPKRKKCLRRCPICAFIGKVTGKVWE